MNGFRHWYKPLLLHFLTPVFFSLLGLFLPQTPLQAFQQANRQVKMLPIVTQTPKLGDNAYKFDWQPIIYRGSSIIAIGRNQLPVPIRLPAGLVPIGHQALLNHCPPYVNFIFDIYFMPKNEPKLRSWISRFPDNFPVAKGSYQANTLHMKTNNSVSYPSGWESHQSAHIVSGSVGFLFQRDHIKSKAEMAMLATGNDNLSRFGERLKPSIFNACFSTKASTRLY